MDQLAWVDKSQVDDIFSNAAYSNKIKKQGYGCGHSDYSDILRVYITDMVGPHCSPLP